MTSRIITSLVFTLICNFLNLENTAGLSNSLDVDFYRVNGFDTRKCGHKMEWEIVSYESIGVNPPNSDSTSALRAFKETCLSSYPILLLPGGVLEIILYVDSKFESSGVVIVLYDESDDNARLRISYDKTEENFISGWNNLTVTISRQINGYINLEGYSAYSDIVLVDSFRYVPENNIGKAADMKPASFKPFKPSSKELQTDGGLEFEDTPADENLLENNKAKIFDYEPEFRDDTENGDDDNDKEEGSGGEPLTEDDNESGFWNPLAISLVSVTGVIVVAGGAGAVYYFTKTRGF